MRNCSMSKAEMIRIVLSHPKADKEDKRLARMLRTSRKHTATLAMLNAIRRVQRRAISI